MIIADILVPLLNANEPEAHLVDIHVKEGQAVTKGTLLFTIETTKAASDIESPLDGYIRLLVKEGATILVAEKIAVLTDTAEEPLDLISKPQQIFSKTGTIRITTPARQLAESLGIALSELPGDRLITEALVHQLAAKLSEPDIILEDSEKPYLLVFGGGGHAKAILDMVKQINQFAIAGILDDDQSLIGKQVLGIPVLETRKLMAGLFGQGVTLAANGVGGILDINIRIRIFEILESAGYKFPSLIHPRATVEESASISDGAQVFANAYVGSEAVLDSRCMVNTNAVISHDCIIGAYAHISPGALLAGHVHVGSRSLIGMGVTTAIGIHIGDGVRIGNGAIILADVPDRTIIQAGRFWTGKAGTSP